MGVSKDFEEQITKLVRIWELVRIFEESMTELVRILELVRISKLNHRVSKDFGV